MASAKPFTNFQGDTHNILGYRDFPKIKKLSDEIRIIVLGGSTVHGGEKPFPRLLESILNEKEGNKYRVYNLGVGSSVSRQDIMRIMVDLAGYSPDLIIHYGGGNDITAFTDPRINYPHRFIHYEHNIFFTQSRDFTDWLISLSMGSSVFRSLFGSQFSNLIHKKIPIYKPSSDYKKIKVQAYLQNMKWGSILSKNIGAKFVSVFQPLISFKKQLHQDELRHTNKNNDALLNSYRELLYQEKSLQAENYSFLDCSKTFENSTKQDFVDVIHLTEKSRKEAANCVAVYLIQNKDLLTWKNEKKEFIPEEVFLKGNVN